MRQTHSRGENERETIPPREILGNHRRQSQESRLELRLYLKYGSQRATILGLAAEREDAGRPIVHADAALTAFYHAMSKRTRARRGVLRAKHVYRVGIPKLLRTAARITAKACSRYWGAAY